MSSPLVSIIIPTYNRAHLIGETLDSVLAQTYQNWECIVVDDGSTDNTENLANIFINIDSRFKYFKRPDTHPKGGNGARNYGFEKSNGTYVNWFDDDDIMLPDFLTDKVNGIKDGCEIIIGYGCFSNANLEVLRKMKSVKMIPNLFKHYVFWESEILLPSVMFSKEVLKNNALFDTTIIRGQETEFFSRMFFKFESKDYCVVNSFQFLYRLHEVSKTGRNHSYNRNTVKDTLFIYHQNVWRGFEIKDREVVQFFYSKIISLWFRSLRHNDTENMKLILGVFKDSMLFRTNKLKCIIILICLQFCYFTKWDSYLIRSYLKRLKLNF